METSLWLSSAFSREFHGSGSPCGHVLQGQQLGGGGMERGLQSSSGRFLHCQRATEAIVALSAGCSSQGAVARGGTARGLPTGTGGGAFGATADQDPRDGFTGRAFQSRSGPSRQQQPLSDWP